MKPFGSMLVAGSLLALGACVSDAGDKQMAGTLLGAGLGGLAGSQFGDGTGQLAMVGAGALLGALMGGEVGRTLDDMDRMLAERNYRAAMETVPTGTTSAWVNPDSGHRGTHTPTRTFQTPTGEYCREFQQTVTIGGRTEEAYGTACRRPDGTWAIVES